MILTKKQQRDLKVIKYFIPTYMRDIEITDKDIKDFFNYSDKGIRVRENKISGLDKMDGYDVLNQGKRWRGIHVHEMYEPSINDGLGYCTVLYGQPSYVIDFLKKEMFKGKDKKVIESLYEN